MKFILIFVFLLSFNPVVRAQNFVTVARDLGLAIDRNGECTSGPNLWKSNEMLCFSFEDHLEQDLGANCLPKVDDVFSGKLPWRYGRVTGHILYLGLYPGQYLFDVDRIDGIFHITLKIALTGYRAHNEMNRLHIATQMQLAQSQWNEKAPAKLRFHFHLVRTDQHPHYTVRLVERTRGPYFFQWGLNWQSYNIRHEIGHMLGLADEYEIVTKARDNCSDSSFMCSSTKGDIHPYHYYLVMKKLFCR